MSPEDLSYYHTYVTSRNGDVSPERYAERRKLAEQVSKEFLNAACSSGTAGHDIKKKLEPFLVNEAVDKFNLTEELQWKSYLLVKKKEELVALKARVAEMSVNPAVWNPKEPSDETAVLDEEARAKERIDEQVHKLASELEAVNTWSKEWLHKIYSADVNRLLTENSAYLERVRQNIELMALAESRHTARLCRVAILQETLLKNKMETE